MRGATRMLIHKSTADRSGHASIRAPVPFIVGVMRSGTTLLRLMLDAHPDLAIPGETWFIPQVAEKCPAAPDPRAMFVATLSSQERWPTFQVSADRLAERVATIEPFEMGQALRAFYQLYAERFGKPRWGDKSPGYSVYMRLIQSLLPEARFIHIIRDGRDIALSATKLRPSADPNKFARTAALWLFRITGAQAQVKDLHHYVEIR